MDLPAFSLSKRPWWLIAVLFLTSVFSYEDVQMEAAGIVPDVISKAPKGFMKIVYLNNVTVNNGAELTPTQVKDKPEVEFSADSNKFYTVIMSDPDAPSRAEPIMREVLHWLVVNIPGADMSKGEVIAEYIGSGPPQLTGLHRYVFLVFEQPGRLTFDEHRASSTHLKSRLQFHTQAFIDKYNLGDPVAGNFYNAQYDDYVPKLHEQFQD